MMPILENILEIVWKNEQILVSVWKKMVLLMSALYILPEMVLTSELPLLMVMMTIHTRQQPTLV